MPSIKFKSKFNYKQTLAILLITAMAINVFMFILPKAETHKYKVSTSDEIVSIVTSCYKQHIEFFEIVVPAKLPEAKMGSVQLMDFIEAKTGFEFNRATIAHSKYWITKSNSETLFEFEVTYRMTQKEEEAAREYARQIVEKLNISGLSDYEKIVKIREYFAPRFTYISDARNAYTTLTTGQGNCAGASVAMAYLLDEAGIASRFIINSGGTHIWLIVRIDGYWYSIEPVNMQLDDIFLLNAYGKPSELIASEYRTSEFIEAYPLGEAQYTKEYHEAAGMNRTHAVSPSTQTAESKQTDNGITAVPTSSTVMINGMTVGNANGVFEAYTINENNYFKLRDIAFAFYITNKKFDVEWDGANNAIILTSGSPYTLVGGEMSSGKTGSQNAILSASKILLDGSEIQLTAYTIGGNNYFKLRDIGQALDFGVEWDGERNTIRIDTSKSYVA